MPRDSKNKFFLSTHLTRMSDRARGVDPDKPRGSVFVDGITERKPDSKNDGERSRIHHAEDGSYTVEHPNGEVSGPHTHMHGAFAAIARERGSGMHHFAHTDELGNGGLVTHSTANGDEPEEREHESADDAAASMGRFFKGEDGEAPGGMEHGDEPVTGRDSAGGRDRERPRR